MIARAFAHHFHLIFACLLLFQFQGGLSEAHSDAGRPLKSAKSSDDCTSLLTLAKFSNDGLKVVGLTSEGLKHLLTQRTELKKAYQIVASEALGAENYIRGLMVAQIAGYNTLMYGGAGAAKTMIIHRLNPNIWITQFSEDSKKMGVLGGQPLAAAEAGREEINLEKSIVRHPVANIDEVDKGPPGLLTALLSLLNTGERFITVGGERIPALTRSVHFTSNLNMARLLEKFLAESMQGTGKAFLDRLQFKMMAINWLPDHLRLEMLNRGEQREKLKALAGMGSEPARRALMELSVPEEIDWKTLGLIADSMFELSTGAMLSLNELAGRFRSSVNKEKIMSQESNGFHEVAPFTPTANLTNRSANELRRAIRASALLDLLLSDLSDQQLTSALAKPIELPTLSIWRTHWMLTSVGPGLTRLNKDTLEIDLNLVNHMDGRFEPMDGNFLASVGTDRQEVQELQYFLKEQQLWISALKDILESERSSRAKVAKILPEDLRKIDFSKINFEAVIARASE